MRRILLVGAVATLSLTTPVFAQLDWSRLPGSSQAIAEAGYAYDSGRDRLVVFGGTRGAGNLAETWEWDGTTWSRRSSAAAPGARVRPAMAYDAGRGVVVLFGGMTGTGTFFDDTWTWDGSNWTRANPSTRPGPRGGAAACFDSERRRVVLFGGFVASGTDANDTWTWDGAAWTRVSSAAAPTARGAHRLAFDAVRGEVVLHGGYSTPASRTLADTWTFDGSSWQSRNVPVNPGSLCDQVLAWDAARQRVVCIGGANVVGTNVTALGGVYDWDGTSWLGRSFATISPGPRSFPYGEFVPSRGRIEIAGGVRGGSILSDQWSLAPRHPASIRSIGAGCAGSAGPVRLVADPGEAPWLGGTYALRLEGAAPSATVASLFVGLSSTNWGPLTLPFDLSVIGANGCLLRTSVELSLSFPVQNGSGVFNGSVCNCPAALGASFYMQAVVPDPGVARQIPVAMSDGVEAIIGAR